MKFLVLMAEEDTWNRWNALSDAEQQAAYDCFTAFTTAVEERGKVIAGDALDRPEQARTVRPGSERLVTEGPFAETVEQMGGFWVVELPDLETAVAAAAAAARGLQRRGPSDRGHRRLTGVPDGVQRRGRLARRVGPPAGPARRAVPPPRPRRGRPRRRVRGRRPYLAGRRHPGQPGRLAADRGPAPDPRPAPRRGGAARKLPLLAVEAELTEEAQRVMADAGERGGRRAVAARAAVRAPGARPEAAAALSLRLVMGVATEDIARLFLVPTPTMAARLTRARKRLARESFDAARPGRSSSGRLALAADIAYLAFTAGYAPGSGPDVLRPDEAAEAIRLARVLREVAPGATSELDSLLALMLLQHSRRDARVDDGGGLVLLPDQDRRRWHHDEIDEAVALLTPWARAPGDAVPPPGPDRRRARRSPRAPPTRTGRGSPARYARAGGTHRLPRRPPQPGGGGRRGRRTSGRAGPPGRPGPVRAPVARRPRPAPAASRPRRRGPRRARCAPSTRAATRPSAPDCADSSTGRPARPVEYADAGAAAAAGSTMRT